MGCVQAVTALLFLAHHATVWNVAALQVAFGAVSAFTRPASTGLIPQAVAAAQLQHANALVDLGRSTMRIAGPAIGAVIVVAVNPGWALAADAASFALSALLRLRLRVARGARPPRTRMLHELREGWGEFAARSWLWSMVSSFGLFQLTLFPALLVLGPVVAVTRLGGPGDWGAILACQAAGSVIGGLAALRFRPARPLLASALLAVPTAVFLASLAAAPPTAVLCAIGFLSSLALTTCDILWMTTFQRNVPEHLVSRLSAFDWFGSVAFNPLGYAFVGPLANLIGVANTLSLAAGLNAVVSVTVALTPGVRGMRGAAGALAPGRS